MAAISRISTQPFRLPLKGNLSWGKGSRLDALEHVLISVQTTEGHSGIAEAPARPTIYGETYQSIEAIVQAHLAPKLIGLDLTDEPAITTALNSVANNHTARGALDIALCDARAQFQGKTLLHAYAGSQRNLSTSFILGMNEIATMVAEARQIFNAGVHVFKTKIGREPKKDFELLTSLNAEFAGEPVTIYADANEGMNPKTAARDLEALAKLGVKYVEEPLPVHMLKARAQLQRDSVLPIIADDSCFTLNDLERELAFDTFTYLNIKTARTGFTASLKMLELAQSAHKGVMFGSQAQSGLGTLHTAILASRASGGLPHELSFPLKLEADTLNQALPYHSGSLHLDEVAEHRLKTTFTVP